MAIAMQAATPHFLSMPTSDLSVGHLLTTSAFLTSFEARPTEGTISFPEVRDGILGVSALTDARIDEAASTTSAVVAEARGLQKALSKWGLKLPYSLPATEGRWAFHCCHSGFQGNDRFVLKSTIGHYVGLDRDFSMIGIGRSGRLASYCQHVLIKRGDDGQRYISTQNYYLHFRKEGVGALAGYLDSENATSQRAMLAIVLALANSIYNSGQYSQQELLTPPEISFENKPATVPLKANADRWALPNVPEQVERAQICLARKELRPGVPISRAEIVWLGTCISISMSRCDTRSPHLVPLSEKLIPLWEGAKLLVGVDPNDYGGDLSLFV